MEIRYYTVNTITELIASEQFLTLTNIPISRHRAISHAHNPRASGDDRILFVAYENDRIAGYLGVLPDRIIQMDAWVKIGWLSCFWVDPEYRGKNISVMLFSSVMEAWDNKSLITNMAPGTMNFYLRTDLFRPPLFKTGIRGYLRFNLATILPPKNPVFKKSVAALKALDIIGNTINSVRLRFCPRYNPDPDIRIEYKHDISPEAERYIAGMNHDERAKRGKAELEWILQYPWILEGKWGDHDSPRYYFSSVAKRFIFQIVEIYDKHNKMIAFLTLSARNDHLTVPCFYAEKERQEFVAKFLINYMRGLKLSMITIFHQGLTEELNKLRSPLLFKKKIMRPYLCPKVLDIAGLHFQDGDGDSIFT